MIRLVPRRWRGDLTAKEDEVILADGTPMTVPRGNLAAAKELLAAQKAAYRRVAARRAAPGEAYAPGYGALERTG